MKHFLSVAAGIIITVVALAYSLAKVDVPSMLQRLSGADYRLMAPYVVILVIYFLITAVNWTLLLRPLGRFSVRQVLPSMMIGFGGNNVLPAHLGEIVRTVVFARQYGSSKGSVLASLVLERVLDVVAILAIYFAVVQIGAPLPDSIRVGANIVALAMVPFCLGLFVFLRFPAPFLRLWAWASAWLPARWSEGGTRLLTGIAHGLSAIESPGRVLAMTGLALLKWSLTGANVWLALHAFHTPIAYNAAMIVIAVSALAVSLPSAPGYLGTLQAAFVFSLTPFGVSAEVSFAASVYYLVGQWVPVTLAGVLSFFFVGIQWKELRREVEAVKQNPTGA